MPKPRPERPNSRRENSKSKLDWLEVAYAAAVEGGITAVAISPLAKRLGVTHGSFYWHFADQAALLKELIERWYSYERSTVQRLSEIHNGEPRDDLREILQNALGDMSSERVRFELALRDLGRRDPEVAHMLVQVDAERTQLFARQFTRIDPDTAQDRAVLLYLALVGAFNALWRSNTSKTFQRHLMDVIQRLAIDATTSP